MNLTITEFVMWALAGCASCILVCALLSRYFHRRAERHGIRRRVICRLCLHAFESASREPTVKCPACGALNLRNPRH